MASVIAAAVTFQAVRRVFGLSVPLVLLSIPRLADSDFTATPSALVGHTPYARSASHLIAAMSVKATVII